MSDLITMVDVLEALIYSLNTTTKNLTIKRLVLQEFIHALNRRGIVANDEVTPLYTEFSLKID